MSVKLYENVHRCNQLILGDSHSDPNHINDVMTFVQIPVSLEFGFAGIQLRVILNPLNVLVVPVVGYVVKDMTGKLSYMKKETFETEYTVVE